MKTKYTKDFPLIAEGLARDGLTDKQIARKLGISKTAYYDYQKLHPEFADSVKKGKAPVDTEVENALLKRALGYEHEEITAEYEPRLDESQRALPTRIRKTTRVVPPDVTAQIFWLKNRRPDLWRDKHDVEHSGNVSLTVISAVPRPGQGK